MPTPTLGLLVGPGRFTELAPEVGIAGLGDRAHDVAAHPHRGEQTLEVISGRARFVAGPDPLRSPDPLDQATDRVRVVEDLVDFGGIAIGRQHRHRDRVFRHILP
jgi:hypothetical protein